MPKAEQIAKYFPGHYYAADPDKLMYHVISTFANKMEDDENNMIRILQSHWIKAIEEIADLELLASLYSDLGEPYGEPINDGVSEGRKRLLRIIQLYLEGPGTVRSIFEFSEIELARYCLFYERDDTGEIILRDESGYLLFDEIENHNFIARAIVKRKLDDEGKELEVGTVELEENPKQDYDYNEPETLHKTSFFINNNGYFTRFPRITITGIKQRTANFLLLNITSGKAIGYRGIIEEGKTLTLIPDEKGLIETAEINGDDKINQVYSISGAQFEKDVYNEEKRARFGKRHPAPTFNNSLFAGTNDERSLYFSPPPNIHVPGIPIGESEWQLQMKPARFNESCFNQYVYHIPEILSSRYGPGKFDEAVYAIEPSANLTFEWKERERASFVLKIPDTVFKEEQINTAMQRIENIVGRVKAAGVKAEVAYYEDEC